MSRTLWHCHIAASLDGRIARADGSVDDWLAADYPAEDFGFAEFFAGVDAILMGRGTYDAVQGFSPWPYAGKPVTVLTSRPIEAPPPDVETRSGDLRTIVEELEGRGHGRIWVEGGGVVVAAMLALGKLDVLEMALIPIILGEGFPLFPPGTAETKLRLVSCAPRAKGALHLVYERA